MKKRLAFFCFRSLIILLSLLSLWACKSNTSKNPQTKSDSDLIFAEQLKKRGSYDSAIIIFEKTAKLNLELKQYTGWFKSTSGLIDCYRGKGDLDEALRIVDKALSVADIRIDTNSNFYNGLIHKKAFLFSDKRQFEQAVALYNRNIKTYLLRSTEPDTGLALAYNGLGTIFLLQNKRKEALQEYQLALNTYEAARHNKSSDYASSLQNIGIVYSMSGNYEKAEQYFLRSLKVKQEVLTENDPQLASLYLNMGRFYQIVRNDPKAIEYMKMAERITISQSQTNSITAGSLYLNMGVFYIYTGDYEKAQSYFNKSLEIITSKAPGNLENLLTIYLNMGFIAEKKGDYNTSKDYYLKGLSIGDKLQNSVKVLRGLANVSYKLKDIKSADAYYKAALNKSIEMYGDEHAETALTYLRYGDFLSATGNNKALVYLNMSLDLYKKAFGPVNIDVSTAYYYIGSNYYRAKNYSKAVSFFQLSLISGFPGFTSDNIFDNPEITVNNLNDNLLNPITAKATALLLMYKTDTTKVDLLKSSASSFALSVKMIEMLRSTYQEEDSKLFILDKEKNTFTNAVLTHVKLYNRTLSEEALNHAFTLSEKGKSAVLLSHLRDKEAKNVGRIPPELLSQDASLKSELFFYNKQIHDQKLLNKPDEEKIKLWNSRIFDLSRKQDELIKSIEKDYPAYYNLKYDNSVIPIDEVQKKLPTNQAIIEYTLTDSILCAFAVTADKKQLFTSPIDSSFFNNLRILRQQLTGKEFNNYSSADFTIFAKASYELYRTLLLPLAPVLKGKDLIIIPDGELGYLSFDVLLTSMPENSKPSYKKLPYLIKESAISYAPSATTFFDELSLKKLKNNGRILAYSPDYSNKNKVLAEKDELGKSFRSTLTDLTNAKDEIISLNKYFKVKSYIGEKATETSFKKNAVNYKVLHLAMHTIINNENPLYSKLIFFKSDKDSLEDGMLNASELINMELHAEMAVLSACNTGSGKMRKGEGIMSLARDFFYAGVPGIIMTSWAVEDRSGTKLMDYFYQFIAQGKSRHEALRLAKIEYLDNCDKLTAHPHYWAAYMNVGDISPIDGFGKKNNAIPIFSAVAAILVISIFLFIRSRRKSKGKQATG
jgi:CHAT domain-containing protein/Tfp pilus assembly protein PilF